MRKIESVEKRRKDLEKSLHLSLENIGTFSLDESTASARNCEQMIGVAQIPMGVAGPILLNPHPSGKSFSSFIPLATTEGALVASVNRGSKAITQSGGADVLVEKVGATRGPVFETKGVGQSYKFVEWLKTHVPDMRKVAGKTSSHIKLLEMEPTIVGKHVFVRFVFDTGKAMGMNMVTIATEAIAKFIEKRVKVKCPSLSGNFCVDKKASWQNFINGRGVKINAEVVLSKKVLRQTLKTTAKKFFNVWLAKCMLGSSVSGSMGFNAQFANVVAAVFLATGQDPAHVVEGSMGMTSAEIIREGLRVGVYLPDIMIGTIGGGTGLATQKEALSIIKGGNLAEVLGGAVLAGEISLLASLSEGSLVKAHKRLGRGEKT
jgi:hydroxymethylglutaryl-CoA reductase (NADPH)